MSAISFVILIIFFYSSLSTEKNRDIRSVFVGKEFPNIDYPPKVIEGIKYEGFSKEDLMYNRLSVINIWASWCTPCRAEHEYLIELRDASIPIYGINYKENFKNGERTASEVEFLGEETEGS